MEILCPWCGERTSAEPDAARVSCIHCHRRMDIDTADATDLAMQAPAREQVLEELLGHCAVALDALLASPDLNLDCLEQATQDAIEVARETLRMVQEAQGERPHA